MIADFLAQFNILDKQLDTIIGSDKFLPYNEKINKIAHGHYPLTPRMRHHGDQLKYFGEIRNLLIHHQGEGKIYLTLNHEALTDLERVIDFVTRPPTLADLPHRELMICSPDDNLADIITQNTKHYNHIPVIQDNKVIGGLSHELLLPWLTTQTDVSLSNLHIRNIPLTKPHHYHCIPSTMSIPDAIHLLANRGDYKMLLIYENDALINLLTRHDIPKIVEKIL